MKERVALARVLAPDEHEHTHRLFADQRGVEREEVQAGGRAGVDENWFWRG